MSGHASFQSVRLCHCRGTLGISFVDAPPLFFPNEEEGGRHFPTPRIGLFSEGGGGAGIGTDKQQRREREGP